MSSTTKYTTAELLVVVRRYDMPEIKIVPGPDQPQVFPVRRWTGPGERPGRNPQPRRHRGTG